MTYLPPEGGFAALDARPEVSAMVASVVHQPRGVERFAVFMALEARGLEQRQAVNDALRFGRHMVGRLGLNAHRLVN